MFLKVSKLVFDKVSKEKLLKWWWSKWNGKLINNKNDRIHVYLKQNWHKREYYIIDSWTDENIFNKLNLFLTERDKTIKRKWEINIQEINIDIINTYTDWWDNNKISIVINTATSSDTQKELNESTGFVWNSRRYFNISTAKWSILMDLHTWKMIVWDNIIANINWHERLSSARWVIVVNMNIKTLKQADSVIYLLTLSGIEKAEAEEVENLISINTNTPIFGKLDYWMVNNILTDVYDKHKHNSIMLMNFDKDDIWDKFRLRVLKIAWNNYIAVENTKLWKISINELVDRTILYKHKYIDVYNNTNRTYEILIWRNKNSLYIFGDNITNDFDKYKDITWYIFNKYKANYRELIKTYLSIFDKKDIKKNTNTFIQLNKIKDNTEILFKEDGDIINLTKWWLEWQADISVEPWYIIKYRTTVKTHKTHNPVNHKQINVSLLWQYINLKQLYINININWQNEELILLNNIWRWWKPSKNVVILANLNYWIIIMLDNEDQLKLIKENDNPFIEYIWQIVNEKIKKKDFEDIFGLLKVFIRQDDVWIKNNKQKEKSFIVIPWWKTIKTKEGDIYDIQKVQKDWTKRTFFRIRLNWDKVITKTLIARLYDAENFVNKYIELKREKYNK